MKNTKPILLALLAAVFYAFNTPLSKLLLEAVPSTLMAGLLYLGAGLGVGILYLFHFPHEPKEERLTRRDLPYTLGMILLDIAAPICLMLGLKSTSAANASLLGNFEIVATTLIALVVFHEAVSRTLWAAVGLITLSSILLTLEGSGSFRFSPARCWWCSPPAAGGWRTTAPAGSPTKAAIRSWCSRAFSAAAEVWRSAFCGAKGSRRSPMCWRRLRWAL